MGDWRAHANKVIRNVERFCRADGITDPHEVLRRIDAAYPFGERRYYPYKAWLDERKKARIRLGLLEGPPAPPPPEPSRVSELPLFVWAE